MSTVNRFFIRLAMLPAAFYSSMGIEANHLKSLLTAKLLMDDRRPNAFQQLNYRVNENEDIKNSTYGTIFLSCLLGCLFLICFFLGKDPVTHLTLFFTMYIVMLAGSLITDFTEVLLDLKDNSILLPKPVHDKTIVAARILHIIIHLSKIALPMGLPAFITITFLHGFAGALLFLPLLVVSILFSVFSVNAAYLFILKITSPDKFKRIIIQFQVVFTTLLLVSYQLIPRLLSNASLEHINLASLRWPWLLPSFWLGYAWHSMYELKTGLSNITAVILCVVAPPLLSYILIRFLAPAFNQKLQSLAYSGINVKTSVRCATPKTISWHKLMCRLTTFHPVERGSFLFTSKMMARSRDFKLKVYPGFGYILIYVFIFGFNRGSFSLQELRSNQSSEKLAFVMLAYLSGMVVIAALQQLCFSARYKAAWIFLVTPLEESGYLITGAVKAAISSFLIPVLFAVSLFCFFVWGHSIIPNLALAFANLLLFTTVTASAQIQNAPFSIPQIAADKANSFIVGIFVLLFLSILGLIHYFIYKYNFIVVGLSLNSLILNYFFIKKLKNKKMAMSNFH